MILIEIFTNGDSVRLETDTGNTYVGIPDTSSDSRPNFIISIPEDTHDGWGAWLNITRNGLSPIRQHGTLWLKGHGKFAEFVADTYILNPSLVGGSHPIPSTERERICGINLTFQGLEVNTNAFGWVNWFEPWIDSLSLFDRGRVYKAKRENFDTHLIIQFSTNTGAIYEGNDSEFGFNRFPATIGETRPQQFKNLVKEIISEGFVPIISYDGDDGDGPMGHPNALRQLPILHDLMDELNEKVLFARLWDGVFYGSSPENIALFGDEFRKLNPNGFLALQHNSGHIPVGEGDGDYKPGGRMRGYDAVLGEFEDSGLPGHGNDTIWQIIPRMIHPYKFPSDKPVFDENGNLNDPNPPFCLLDSSRGKRFYCAFEWNTKWGEYAWVRKQVSKADVVKHRQYFKDFGCLYTG